jgi:hypothetical protein
MYPLSPRTAKYVEAMIRGGDDFDYNNWLRKVQAEEAQANRVLLSSGSGQTSSVEIGSAIRASHSRQSARYVTRPSMARTTPMPRAVARPGPVSSSTRSKDRLRRRLEEVHVKWRKFQGDRSRDAVYDYLQAVFAIVVHFKVRRRTKRLLRHAYDFADLPFDKKADFFTAVIRCTSRDAADNKLISKWARALRYAAKRKPREMQLTVFMKAAGGVNGCAAGYAKNRRWYRRRRSHKKVDVRLPIIHTSNAM